MNRDELEQMEDEAVKEAHLELVSDHDRYQYEIKDLIRKKFAEKIAAVEREACAKVAEERWLDKANCTAEEMYEMQKKSIADAIRARREQ